MKAGVWTKSSKSNGNGGNNCLEVLLLDTVIAVRDSKNPTGPNLVFNPDAWDAFVQGIRADDFKL